MGVTFQSSGLSLGRKLQRLSTEGKTIARAALASTIRDLILEGYIRETDPRGRKWAPRKDSLPHPILDKTGAMKRGYEIDMRGANIVVENNVVSDRGRPYPLFHQTGTSKMVARKPLPDRSLSPYWRSEFDKTVRVSLERLT
jgi:phage gpG-like protein